MATADAPAPLLNLDTIHAAQSVIIDGTPYAIAAPDGLSLMALRQLRPLIVKVEILRALDTLTDEQQAEEEALLNGICRAVLKAPDEVHKRLDGTRRLLIYLTFLELPSSVLQLLGAKSLMGANPSPSTGASSPQPSPASTGARRSSGLRKSRAGS